MNEIPEWALDWADTYLRMVLDYEPSYWEKELLAKDWLMRAYEKGMDAAANRVAIKAASLRQGVVHEIWTQKYPLSGDNVPDILDHVERLIRRMKDAV